jgi:hypothetical protein
MTMSVNTLVEDRKRAAMKRKAAELAAERSARLERACKAWNLIGTNLSPTAAVSVLTKYIERLKEIKVEMSSTFADILGNNSLGLIDVEISRALKQIIDLKIEEARPPQPGDRQ